MAPARTRKQDTSVSSDEDIPNFPAPPTTSQAILHTPRRSPAKGTAGITQAQKQQLIDNLQYEITQRARRLRAQYAQQAQDLRSRVERRVNRIPQALRKRNIQELMDEHAAKAKPAPAPPVPVLNKPQPAPVTRPAPAIAKQTAKRKSDEISTGDDKENVPSQPSHDLANPKKRTKTGAVLANSKATRTASRKAGPAGVLSPKSHNSRTLPQSPFKSSNLSPEKPQPSRPMSAAAAPKPATRAPSRQTKRAAPQTDLDGRTSGASNSSAGTTIVTKPATRKAPVPKKPAPAAKTAAAAARKTAATKPDAPPPRVGRTLRSRN